MEGYKTDTSGEVIDNLHNYSEQEQIIGKWIDGKPICRKILQFQLTKNTQKIRASYEHGIENIDEIIRFEAYMSGPMGDWKKYSISHIPYIPDFYNSSSNKAMVFIQAITKNVIYIDTADDRSNFAVRVFIEYTKTTD